MSQQKRWLVPYIFWRASRAWTVVRGHNKYKIRVSGCTIV
jgi:hypothetical protein